MKLRPRRANSFQFEALEDRALLNAAIPASPSAEIHILKKPVTQVLQGPLTGTFTVKGQTVTLTGTANLGGVLGTANLTGKFKIAVNARTQKATVTGGTLTLTSGANKLTLSFTGTGKNSLGVFTLQFHGPVSGGAGTFKGATGSFTASGTASELDGTFQMNATATVKTKA